MDVHLISNGNLSLEEFSKIAVCVNEYIDVFHIREKQLTARELYDGVKTLIQVGIPHEKIMINDRMDVAAALQVKGGQLAYHSLPVRAVRGSFPHLNIGCSIHSLEEGLQAEKDGANYVLFGHIYQTESKRGLEPRGIGQLKAICDHLQIPVIAIGGVTPENIGEIMQSGASGVATMSGILDSKDPLETAKKFKIALQTAKGGKT
jgi:thiazole tautomerase (transcriptional regulator TenI)